MTPFSESLEKYQVKANTALKKYLDALGGKSTLRDACSYAVMNGGKRVRPAIVFMVAQALGQGREVVSPALAVEFLHCSSLIADDLPCMDDDDMRRNKPSTHKVYGEAVALLASYTLISAAYDALYKAGEAFHGEQSNKNLLRSLGLELITHSTGIHGATGGQFLDVFPSDLDSEKMKMILHKKTSSLFEVAFGLGWLFGGGAPSSLAEARQLARHFGLAFQLSDDLADLDQDGAGGAGVNYAALFGVEETVTEIEKEVSLYQEMLDRLSISTPELIALGKVPLAAVVKV